MSRTFVTTTINKQEPSEVIVEVFGSHTFKSVYPLFHTRMETIDILSVI